jgi:hypothetical protein
LGLGLAGFVGEGGGFPGLHPVGTKSRVASSYEMGVRDEARAGKRVTHWSWRIFGGVGGWSGCSRRERCCEDKAMTTPSRGWRKTAHSPCLPPACALSTFETLAMMLTTSVTRRRSVTLRFSASRLRLPPSTDASHNKGVMTRGSGFDGAGSRPRYPLPTS